jgi:hypothetical protein
MKRIIKIMKEQLQKLIEQYWDKFGEGYPLEMVQETQDESIASIEKCLKQGKPRKVDSSNGKLF